MIGQPFVLHLIHRYLFSLPCFVDHHYLAGGSILPRQISTLQPQKGFAMPYVLLIYRIEIAFSDAEIVDGIQQIGLATAVVAGKTYHPLPE